MLLPILEKLKKRGVRVIAEVPLKQNNNYLSNEATESLSNF